MNINAVIDTGANSSVISARLAKKLNLPIKNINTMVTMANNHVTKSPGYCENVPIIINKSNFPCKAIVLDESAHELLIGTNWLDKYRANIDFNSSTITLMNDYTNKLKFFCSKKPRKSLYKKLNDKEKIPLYSKFHRIIPSRAICSIDIKPLSNYAVDSGVKIMIYGDKNTPGNIANGVYDSSSELKPLIISNINSEPLIIQKGQKVTYAQTCKNCTIEPSTICKSVIDEEKIQKSYKGNESDKEDFMKMIIEANKKEIIKKEIELKHDINLEDPTKIFNQKQYKHSASEKEAINQKVIEMLEDGVIRPSFSNYSSPIVLIKKPDGSYRPCVDYRRLNSNTIKDVYPLPRIDETRDQLGEAAIFSKIDLKNGFWHIPIKESSKKLTAFRAGNKLYEFNKLPFGLCNSPATFQRVVDSLLGNYNLEFALIYLDDLIIYSKSKDEHLEKIQKILLKLRSYSLNINYEKSEFCKETIDYLGYIIGNGWVKISDEKTRAVKFFPKPKNTKQVQQFIGLTSYFRRFINNYARICLPLTSLLRKNNKFRFEENEIKAFNKLKELLTKEPILKLPRFGERFTVHTDACKDGLGAILLQKYEDKIHVIAYASRITNNYEKNYSTYELEGLAALFAIKVWRCYLYVSKFTLHTDNSALSYIKTNKNLSARLSRWILVLAEYDFDVVHRKGTQNQMADALSRNAIDKIYSSNTAKSRKIIENGKKKIIKQIHCDLGHANYKTVYRTIKEEYYWPKMRDEIESVVRSCLECARFNKNKRMKIHYPILVGESFERIGIDTMGPLRESHRGCRYILVAIDYLTKYVMMKAVKSKTAEEVAKFIYEDIILIHGPPHTILSDNGREYKNEILNKLCDRMKINRKYSTPYRPQTNGLVERTNQSLLGILAKNTYLNPKNWDKYINLIRYNYNTRFNSSIGMSPFELIFGRKPNVIFEENTPSMKERTSKEIASRISEIQSIKLKEIRDKQLKAKREISPADMLTIGEVVLIKNLLRNSKFEEKWIGPYIVQAIVPPLSYILIDSNRSINKIAHRKDIKRLHVDDEDEILMSNRDRFEDV